MHSEINSALEALLDQFRGKIVGRTTQGLGSIAFIDFEPVAGSANRPADFCLALYLTAWRLERRAEFLAGSESDRGRIGLAFQRLWGRTLHRVEVAPTFFDAVLQFDDDYHLRVFATYSADEEDEVECWSLLSPRSVLKFVPGGWIIEPRQRKG